MSRIRFWAEMHLLPAAALIVALVRGFYYSFWFGFWIVVAIALAGLIFAYCISEAKVKRMMS